MQQNDEKKNAKRAYSAEEGGKVYAGAWIQIDSEMATQLQEAGLGGTAKVRGHLEKFMTVPEDILEQARKPLSKLSKTVDARKELGYHRAALKRHQKKVAEMQAELDAI